MNPRPDMHQQDDDPPEPIFDWYEVGYAIGVLALVAGFSLGWLARGWLA